MSLRQKLIVIENRTDTITIAQPEVKELRIVSCPDDLQVFGLGKGWKLTVKSGARRLDYRPLIVEADGVRVEIPTRIFGAKECFVCVTTTCNYHWGCPVDKIKQMEAEGIHWMEWEGDGLTHHGINYPASRQMAELAHEFGFPMTFIVDVQGAEAGGADFARWHREFGDDVGVMPSSYWHRNNVNYNTDRPAADSVNILRYTRRYVQSTLARQGMCVYPLVAGVDQFVGSFGSHWAAAARANGFRGFWGTCFDHATCDSSCHHEGLPWDGYRISRQYFRYPELGTDSLWGYTWTVYDLCNSFLEYPSSGAFYNAEASLVHGFQSDYTMRNLQTRIDNMDSSDFSCFVFHDEDHDIWRSDLLAALRRFLSAAPKDRITPATLEEVTQWLDLRFADGSHPANLIEAVDPVTCHDSLLVERNKQFTEWPGCPSNIGWTAPQPPHWKSVNGHNPSVLLYYGADARWAVVEGEHVPRQYIDYAKFDGCTETGAAPKKAIPQLSDWREGWVNEDGRRRFHVNFRADCSFPRLPLVLWDRADLKGTLQTDRTRVTFVSVRKGENSVLID